LQRLIYSLIKLALISIVASGCASQAQQPEAITTPTKPIPEQKDRGSINQMFKTDFDRLADIEIRENTQSMRTLMLKLYKRNPQELKKNKVFNTNTLSAEEMVSQLFDHEQEHHYRFSAIENAQSTEAIFLAFKPQYEGDRIFAYIVGLETMLIKAHGGKYTFNMLDDIEPQYLYNVARNVEIAAWKLANSKDKNGKIYLLSNELNANEKNLSIEREFGKIIGRTDLFAISLAEKTQRTITRVIQNIATALFLPF
jgi:hypothetical protein